ncbi:MAG: hypothetical protein A3J62_04165 [Candidatus Buchananbacteria bacterium RIFCSPHIGHO2_02_FULL_38_8]|uniref:DUF5667 domain-containing protein n=2 Tax=Candidatus Buchananiibacteriota TaxID=1817903 RepID=A0A1G1XV81_9BACT|nr:MAG: hypothetical protein A2731_01635 [Candidatus Buchananbacteria bacterium RIFCSPHIGHO2_01_FULL_39_8]OGY47655.1 MAG: hypothetical protein A3J62_04165 [Candidatus Buchananbacteria bacterium RIFCSPHIGHO2_02_FULL_38_8]
MKNFKKPAIFVLSFIFLFTLPYIVLAANDKGKAVSAEHRSRVAEVVQQLTAVANQDENIGEEVSQVAQAENEAREKVATIIEKIETRGKFKTFLLGTDYKNIGALRSELVTTANHIERLSKALERTIDEEVKAELNAQITALEEAKTKVESFIQTNESKFSLLGWLVKFFNR